MTQLFCDAEWIIEIMGGSSVGKLTADKTFEAENTKRMKVFSLPLMWLIETKWKVRKFALKMKCCDCTKIGSEIHPV